MPIDVYFATNRQPIMDEDGTIVGFGDDPGPVSGLDIRYGVASVEPGDSGETSHVLTIAVYSENVRPREGEHVTLGSEAAFDAIRGKAKADGVPIVTFLHGFANSFLDSVARAGWNAHFIFGGQCCMFVFSWPSTGSKITFPLIYRDYLHDRRTAVASGTAIARVFSRLYDYMRMLDSEDYCEQPLHLLVHSMGCYALRHAVQALLRGAASAPAADLPKASAEPVLTALAREFDPFGIFVTSTATPVGEVDPTRLRVTFDSIVLAAADEDADAFDLASLLKFLPRMGRRIAVYHSHRDWVLGLLSGVTKFNGPRLGSEGPDNMATISDKVHAVDVSDVLSFARDPQHHQYYRSIPAVRDDIAAVFKGLAPGAIPWREPVSLGRWRLLAQVG